MSDKAIATICKTVVMVAMVGAFSFVVWVSCSNFDFGEVKQIIAMAGGSGGTVALWKLIERKFGND